MYDVMVHIDVGSFEPEDTDVAAVEEALVLGFIKPVRFKTVQGVRMVAAYEVTSEGREFLHRIDDEFEAKHRPA